MSAPMVRWRVFLGRGCMAFAFLPPLVTRLVLGHAYYQAGVGKWTHAENAVTLFAAVGLPLPEASVLLVSRVETFGGIALALGLLTRPVASVLAVVMAVALATADLPRLVEALGPGHTFGPADITSFVFLILLAWLVAYGAGPVSLDRLVLLAWRRRFAMRSLVTLAPELSGADVPHAARLSRANAPQAQASEAQTAPVAAQRTHKRRRR